MKCVVFLPQRRFSRNNWIWQMAAAVVVPLVLFSCNNPEKKKDDLSAGATLYKRDCAGCHGPQLKGGVGASLVADSLKHGNSEDSIAFVIDHGVQGTEMPAWKGLLKESEVASLAGYITAVRKDSSLVMNEALPSRVNTRLYSLHIEKLVTSHLNGPWGIEFADSTHALITGKMGELYWLVNNKLDTQKITGLPEVYAYDMVGGMMDLALDPGYSRNGWVYIGYSSNPTNSKDKHAAGMTKIVRGKVKDHAWVDQQTLFQVPDSLLVVDGTRWGCRLFFDKEGYLYFTIGDMEGGPRQSSLAPQQTNRAQGKIYRINKDGSIPTDNPLTGRKHDLQAIYCWGVRNVEGIAQHPETGTIYFTDHGPKGGDELNRLKKGGNYGWPLVTYGVNYDGTIISKDTARPGLISPLTHWTPSIAVCAAEFVRGDLFPKWKDNLLVTALKFQELRRLVVEGDKVTDQEILLKGYGRVRDIKFAADGSLYVLTNGPDELLRVTPD